MKGRPLKLDEEELMAKSQTSFKSKKTDKAPSEAAWSYNKPAEEEAEEGDV